MNGWRASWNAGMILGVLLLVGGGTMMFLAPEEGGTLHSAGLGVVILAGVVYLVARVALLLKERRQ